MSSQPGTSALRVLERALDLLARPWLRGLVVLGICLYGLDYYRAAVDKIYPIETWLVWDLLSIWGWVALLSVSCVSVGHLIVERLKLDLLPFETLVQSMAVGLVAFVMCMYVGGALQLYGAVFAVALPVVLIGVGARSTWRLARRLWAELREPLPASPFVWTISALGAFCIGLAYLGVMTPDALNYDSTWSHLVIAQDYSRHGGIIKFYGNYNMGVPHFASIVHTWGYSVPGLGRTALRWMMALHTEFSLFLWTLAGVAVGVRRMLSEPRLRGSWTAFFLFPIFFVYDNNMGGAADHVAAFFAVPIFLAACKLWNTCSPRAAALLAFPAAGAFLTKYQAAYFFVPLALLLVARFTAVIWRMKRGTRRDDDPAVNLRDLVRAPLVLAGLGALLVSPHFIKNAVFHHNPLYPFAQDVFTSSTPSSPNAGPLIRYLFTDDTWRPKGTTSEKIWNALKLCLTFSWEPHYSFTKNVPAFGSLFTLLLPVLFVIRKSLYIWLGAVIALGALFLWAYTYNLDRNLQIFMPLMVCVTAALSIRAWRLGWLARAGLIPLVAFQTAWGGDAFFYSASDRIESAFRLIRSGYDGRAKQRFQGYRSGFLALNKLLPKDARVLLHTSHVTLGIEREVVMDWDAFQGFISYDQLFTARQTYDYLKERGITHVLLESRSRPAPTKQEEVLFNDLLSRDAKLLGGYGQYKLYEFPKKAPPAEEPYQVVTMGLANYADGLYPIGKLSTHEYLPAYVLRYAAPDEALPPGGEARAAMLERADAVILSTRSRLEPESQTVLDNRFSEVVRYDGFAVYVVGKGRKPI